jgi:hypothetical protein
VEGLGGGSVELQAGGGRFGSLRWGSVWGGRHCQSILALPVCVFNRHPCLACPQTCSAATGEPLERPEGKGRKPRRHPPPPFPGTRAPGGPRRARSSMTPPARRSALRGQGGRWRSRRGGFGLRAGVRERAGGSGGAELGSRAGERAVALSSLVGARRRVGQTKADPAAKTGKGAAPLEGAGPVSGAPLLTLPPTRVVSPIERVPVCHRRHRRLLLLAVRGVAGEVLLWGMGGWFFWGGGRVSRRGWVLVEGRVASHNR